ncbi:hypothetical protein ACLMJK_005674 [Lecanora helva]
MLFSIILTFSTILTQTISLGLLEVSLAKLSHAPKPSPSADLTLPANISRAPSNHPISAKKLKIICDDQRWGRNLKVKSCRDLFGYLRQGEELYSFAQRDSGIPHDIPLPIRTLSNDGVCFLQPVLAKDAVRGEATATEIFRAGAQILRTCIIERGMGGLAFDIGGDNNIQIIISNYNPNVKCDTTSAPGPPWDSTVNIFSAMRAGRDHIVFGYRDLENIDVGLPLTLESQDGRCELTIDIPQDAATVSSWYEIWEETTAIASMCTRWRQKGGRSRGLGAHRNIFLNLSEKSSSTLPSVVESEANVTDLVATNNVGASIFEGEYSPIDLADLEHSVPFELVSSPPTRDNTTDGLTLPGVSSADASAMTEA